jgi:uncharacterized membrane protein YcaP (DUF421 family)
MESVIRGAVIYLLLLVILRLSGRRTMSEMTAFDFVLLLIVAETTQQALLGDDFSLTNSAILIVTLFTMDIGMSLLKEWSPRLQRILDGSPTVLISEGKLDERALRRARVSIHEIMEVARSTQGLERLDQIKFAVLEAKGSISIIPFEDR